MTQIKRERELSEQHELIRLLESYSGTTHVADAKVMEYFQIVTQKTQQTFATNARIYVVLFISGLVIVGAGLYIGLFIKGAGLYQKIFSFVDLIAGLGIMFALIIRSPMKSIRYLISNMIKLNIILAGYVRQIAQADIIFRELMMASKETSLEDIKGTILSIQDIIDQTGDHIDRLFDEIF